jgi:N-acetylmuramoyl-L-alanine amidase
MKIFINPGHAPDGNPDPGAVNALTGLRECDVALNIGLAMSGYLQAVGYQTVVIQSDSLSGVCGSANSLPADLFVSIHCNAATNADANGTETWYCHNSAAGEKLATLIQGQIVNALPVTDRGLKEATPGVNGLYVLTNTDMPAVLVETAFISNPEDEQLLGCRQDEFARAIARGITDYVGTL